MKTMKRIVAGRLDYRSLGCLEEDMVWLDSEGTPRYIFTCTYPDYKQKCEVRDCPARTGRRPRWKLKNIKREEADRR